MQIYLADYDDVLCGYRWSVSNSLPPINSYYLSLGASDPKKATLDACGLTTIHAEFFNRLIQPYHKNDELFRSPGYPNAWVNFQDKNLIGTCQGADTNFHSYGGQDSIAANNYLMRANAGTPMSKVAEVSNTLMFVDATYYNSLPAQPLSGFCKIDGYAPNPTTYSHYWKHLGNNLHNFNSPGNPDPDDPSNATVWSNINARYSGVLNVIMCDTSSKSRPTKDVVYNLRQKLDQFLSFLEEQGIDFWWIDWQQGDRTTLPGLDPLYWLNHLHFYDLARDGKRRPFIFSRWGGLRSHQVGCSHVVL